MKFSSQIALVLLVLLLLTSSVLTYFSSRLLESSLLSNDREWSRTLLSTIAEGIAHDTINRNALHATETLQNIVDKTRELSYAYVTDFEGRIFAHTFTEGFPKKLLNQHRDGERRIILDGREILEMDYPIIEGMDAHIHIGNDLRHEKDVIASALRKVAFFFAGIVLAGIAIGFILSRRLAKPLEVITDNISHYGKGADWQMASRNKGALEIRNLVSAFDDMISMKEASNLKMKQFMNTLDQTLDCVFMFDPETLKFFYTNQGAQLQVGYTANELANMTAVDIKPHFDEKSFREMLKPLINGDVNTLRFETEHQHRDGHLIPVEIFLQYVSALGEEPRFVAMVQDISERRKKDAEIQNLNADLERRIKLRTAELEASLKQLSEENSERIRAETALLKAKEDAEKANKLKSDFLGRMSHELRTPMNAILGFGQLLEAEHLTEAQFDYVKEVMDAGKHLLHLIDEVLDLAKIESGKIELSMQNVSVQDITNETMVLVGSMANAQQIKLENFIDDKSLFVKADNVRLKEILTNLMTNAIKYNSQNGTVTINAMKRDGHTIRIQVTDTGRGLTSQEREILFEPFNRLGAEYSDIEGTGIGLTISRQLAELMNGCIDVESEAGIGSTFWVDLEMAKVEVLLPGEEQILMPRALPINFMQVLYVEDNPANLRLVQKALKSEQGVSLTSATSAELGLEMAKSMRPDLIIMDINLPGMDGYEALSRLRNYNETQEIPVVALSAAAMPRDIERGLLAGFRRYLTKPIQIEELRQVINDFAIQKQSRCVN